MRLYTIGFTQRSAEAFFGLVRAHRVRSLLDVRLNNRSQLAGFTKRDDLRYFTRALCNIDYREIPLLAPSAAILNAFKKDGGDWAQYQTDYLKLLRERRPESELTPAQLDGGCLLCSEPTPEQCHRRLAAEYLRDCWGAMEIVHL